MLPLGFLVCIAAYCAGRGLARRWLRLPGVRVLGKRADDSYFAAPRARRLAFRLAGPAATYLACVLLLFAMQVAQPQREPTTTLDVVPGGPAAAAGMVSGDRVLAIDGVAILSWSAFKDLSSALGPAHTASIRVRRGDAEQTLTVTTGPDGRLQLRPRMEPIPTSAAATLA